jgi:methionine-rich copper-binding protein CopC
MPSCIRPLCLGFVLLTALPYAALARTAQVIDSTPKAESIMDGRNEKYVVRFDGPVDHRGSTLSILHDGHIVRTLHPRLDAAPEVLFASAPRLPAGDYELAWSVKSVPDGEPTQGSVHFAVRDQR